MELGSPRASKMSSNSSTLVKVSLQISKNKKKKIKKLALRHR